jgi:hypothetical protein
MKPEFERDMGISAVIPPGAPFQSLFNMDSTYTLAEYTVYDNYEIGAFLDYLERSGALRGTHYLFLMDTEDLERIGSNIELFDLLFPVVAVLLALTGGLLPGLMILQAAKEAALLRILGTSKRRTRSMLSGQQLILCALGLALGLALLWLYNGTERIATIAGPLRLVAGLNSAGFVIAAVVSAVAVTRRKILELIQTKE